VPFVPFVPFVLSRHYKYVTNHGTISRKMEIERISRWRYCSTIVWAVVASITVVVVTAGLARATLNIKGALIEKPEIAVYLLLPEKHITSVEVLREEENARDFLVSTEDGGSLLIKMKKGEKEWYIEEKERLH
jgi:hypothetical protein